MTSPPFPALPGHPIDERACQQQARDLSSRHPVAPCVLTPPASTASLAAGEPGTNASQRRVLADRRRMSPLERPAQPVAALRDRLAGVAG